MSQEVTMQEPILIMDLQETPTGEWDCTKGWPHLKYTELERTQIANHPTNYYLQKKAQWHTQSGRTILPIYICHLQHSSKVSRSKLVRIISDQSVI